MPVPGDFREVFIAKLLHLIDEQGLHVLVIWFLVKLQLHYRIVKVSDDQVLLTDIVLNSKSFLGLDLFPVPNQGNPGKFSARGEFYQNVSYGYQIVLSALFVSFLSLGAAVPHGARRV